MPTQAQHRVLLATDVPFWRNADGAQQRITSIVQFLTGAGHHVETFFLSPQLPLEPQDVQQIERFRFNVVPRSSDQIPRHLWSKLRWYFDATLNHYLRAPENRDETVEPEIADRAKLPTADRSSPVAATTTLADYRWPWAIEAFHETVDTFSPTVILIEYVKLAYLLDALKPNQRRKILCVLDTHDVLHQRYQQFQARGLEHWLLVNREQEAEAVARFDVAMAIQYREAEVFQAMAPQTNVITVGHRPPTDPGCRPPTCSEASKPVRELVTHRATEKPGWRIGFIGSHNQANAAAVQRLLKVWPQVPANVQLVIGGSVCRSIDTDQIPGTVKPLGPVDSVQEFYDQIDIAINPVEFGTGLKIKSIEALHFGKPLWTTRHAAIGLPCVRVQPAGEHAQPEDLPAVESLSAAIRIYHQDVGLRELIDQLNDPNYWTIAVQAAQKLASTELSEQSVYAELDQVLSLDANLKKLLETPDEPR